MVKKARQPRSRPKPIVMERPKKDWKSNNENTIVLPENLNQNRSTKALFGISITGSRSSSNNHLLRTVILACSSLISSCIGVSLIIQSIPKKRLSIWDVIPYTIISIFVVGVGVFILFASIFRLY